MTLAPYLRKWTPVRAEQWCATRIERIDNALLEIAYCWGDIDDYIVRECDRLRRELETMRGLIKDAKEHELEHPGVGDA